MAAPAVTLLEWSELTDPSTTPPALLTKLGAAFGYDGLGILAVRGVPGLAAARAAALPHAWRFGSLPAAVQAKYEHAASTYSFGWSHGKESFDGRPDTAKGSFYANPVHDAPFADAAVIASRPAFAHPNIWPADADAPGFVGAYKALACVMVDAGQALASHVDSYVTHAHALASAGQGNGAGAGGAEYPPAPGTDLAAVVRHSRTHKARLLYYFPPPPPTATPTTADRAATGAGATAADASWCGWHNDHGSLTALTPAMYFDAATGAEVPCPDPAAGLYIRSRSGATVRVAIPPDCLAFQIGETAQVHSGGVLQATPHYVRAPSAGLGAGVGRGTMAVFMEPEWTAPMACAGLADGDTPPEEGGGTGGAVEGGAGEVGKAGVWARVLRGARGELLPPGVVPLAKRWTGPAQSFGDFTDRTLSSYY